MTAPEREEICLEENCADYRGRQTRTENGNVCLPWNEVGFGSDEMEWLFNGLGINYCRNLEEYGPFQD